MLTRNGRCEARLTLSNDDAYFKLHKNYTRELFIGPSAATGLEHLSIHQTYLLGATDEMVVTSPEFICFLFFFQILSAKYFKEGKLMWPFLHCWCLLQVYIQGVPKKKKKKKLYHYSL